MARGRKGRKRESRPAAVILAGVLTLAAVGVFIWLAENSYNGLPFLSYRYVNASLPNIGHVQQHDPVDIDGVRVGQVLNTSTRDNRALIELQLQGVGPLPVDSKVIVRADGLLGERYIELEPGASTQMLANHATIQAGTEAQSFYNGLPETLNLFNSKTRAAMGDMINSLGEGMLGRGQQLNQAIHVGAPSGANFDAAANAILARPGAAVNFLPDTNSGVTALDDARTDLADSLHPIATGLQPLISERAGADSAIAAAPSFENAVDRGFSGPTDQLLTSLDTVAGAADAVLPAAPGALRAATALLRQTPEPLRAAEQVFREVPRAVPSTLSILASVKPNLAPLTQGFVNLVPPISNLAEHGCDIQSFATGVRSLVNFGTTPGYPFGPDVGFPLSVEVGTDDAADFVNTGQFPTEDDYPAPCAYSPGVVNPEQTLLSALGGSLPSPSSLQRTMP